MTNDVEAAADDEVTGDLEFNSEAEMPPPKLPPAAAPPLLFNGVQKLL
jgi:hypothetical protein